MSRRDEQAFPSPASDFRGGMTLREYYAGLAMQGLLANAPRSLPSGQTAAVAVDHADALLAELAKGKP